MTDNEHVEWKGKKYLKDTFFARVGDHDPETPAFGTRLPDGELGELLTSGTWNELFDETKIIFVYEVSYRLHDEKDCPLHDMTGDIMKMVDREMAREGIHPSYLHELYRLKAVINDDYEEDEDDCWINAPEEALKLLEKEKKSDDS